jgi:hypothetical protein
LLGVAAGAVAYPLPLERPRRTLQLGPVLGDERSNLATLYFSPDSRRLITLDDAGVWDMTTGAQLATLAGIDKDGIPWSLAFAPDGRQVAGAFELHNAIAVWDPDTGERKVDRGFGPRVLTGWHRMVQVTYTPDGRLLSGESHSGRQWDHAAGRVDLQRSAPAIADGDPTVRTDLSGPGPHLHVRWTEERIDAYDLSTGERCTFPSVGQHSFKPVGMSEDRRILCGQIEGGWNRGDFVVYDPEAGAWKRVPALDRVDKAVLSVDGRWVAGHMDAEPNRWVCWLLRRDRTPQDVVLVHDLTTGEQQLIPDGLQASFAPDGRTLAVRCVGGTVELWDFPLGKPWGTILGIAACTAALAWLLIGWLGRRRMSPGAERGTDGPSLGARA